MGMGFLKCIGVEKFNFKKNFKPIEIFEVGWLKALYLQGLILKATLNLDQFG